MADFLQRKMPDEELRLLTLYTLSRLGPCTDMNLLEFMTQNDLMNYFDLMFALTDLCRLGMLVRQEKDAAWHYEMTPAGQDVLTMFEKRVRGSCRDTVDRQAASWKERLTRERYADAQITQTERGEFEVRMTLKDQTMPLISVTLYLPTSDMAHKMADGWRHQAGGVYQTILGLLKGENA